MRTVKKRAGMSQHEKQSIDGSTDVWLTPMWILHALSAFDLDPCAAPSPRPWPTAAVHIELPSDGLFEDWYGRVWLNPPYSNPIPWLKKMSRHGNGVALLYARTDTLAWQRLVFPFAHSILFLSSRVDFCLPDGTPKSGSGSPSALVAYSFDDTLDLYRSTIPGALVQVSRTARRRELGESVLWPPPEP